MRFVKVPDRPNVWLMASAPDTPKIAELTNSAVAIFFHQPATGQKSVATMFRLCRRHTI
ncbi:hypothetical protein [Weissella confusa]|uniref:hypothetical protein n=1 Tax=Weissella confusa TaxID=1583 RepID=UPI0012E87456|nr:hypothetical protein [Weissella confusa]MBJ7699317.1 hypothetical protein [Weissella confusa]MCQ8097362.1 hypothetical protein [Weissella confusa]MCQ8146706.1 hypothetical protein [Weissella confusa]